MRLGLKIRLKISYQPFWGFFWGGGRFVGVALQCLNLIWFSSTAAGAFTGPTGKLNPNGCYSEIKKTICFWWHFCIVQKLSEHSNSWRWWWRPPFTSCCSDEAACGCFISGTTFQEKYFYNFKADCQCTWIKTKLNCLSE